MKFIYAVIFSILLVFIFTFSLENSGMITLKYYGFFTRIIPVYGLIVISFLAGILVAGVAGIVERFRLSMTIRKMDKTIKGLRLEIKDSEQSPIVKAEKDMTR